MPPILHPSPSGNNFRSTRGTRRLLRRVEVKASRLLLFVKVARKLDDSAPESRRVGVGEEGVFIFKD